jgi:hypothetical protein
VSPAARPDTAIVETAFGAPLLKRRSALLLVMAKIVLSAAKAVARPIPKVTAIIAAIARMSENKRACPPRDRGSVRRLLRSIFFSSLEYPLTMGGEYGAASAFWMGRFWPGDCVDIGMRSDEGLAETFRAASHQHKIV